MGEEFLSFTNTKYLFRSIFMLTSRECGAPTMWLAVKLLLSLRMTTWMTQVSTAGSSFQIWQGTSSHQGNIADYALSISRLSPPRPCQFNSNLKSTDDWESLSYRNQWATFFSCKNWWNCFFTLMPFNTKMKSVVNHDTEPWGINGCWTQ